MKFGKVSIIVNPAARSGKAASYAEVVRKQFNNAEVVFTSLDSAISDLAAVVGKNCDTLFAVGGDGLIHDIMNGLMQLEREERPVFGLIPAGTGNDFADTLGMSHKVSESLKQLDDLKPVNADLLCCNSDYCMETISFGLDAAIAIGTVERRKTSKKQGTALFLEEGIDQLLHHLDIYDFDFEYVDENDEKKTISQGTYTFAIQNGPSYGGGFKICPDAKIDDGLIDVCYTDTPFNVVSAIRIFLKAKDGKHTTNKKIHLLKAKELTVKIHGKPTIQFDGEKREFETLHVTVAKNALTILSAR